MQVPIPTLVAKLICNNLCYAHRSHCKETLDGSRLLNQPVIVIEDGRIASIACRPNN